MSAPGGAEVADVVVVGGGPAGAALSRLLALDGFHVHLLERRPFPRPKACGDCLSPGATPLLERLGLLEAVLGQSPAELTGWRIVAPSGESFESGFGARSAPLGVAGDLGRRRVGEAGSDSAASPVSEPMAALALARDRLDHVLLDGARDAGVTVRQERVLDVVRDRAGRVTGVVAQAASGTPRRTAARLVVGADGLRSIIARRLGLIRRAPRVRKASLTLHVEGVQDPGTVGEMHVADGACAGFAAVGRADASGTCPVNLTLVVDVARWPPTAPVEAFFWERLAQFPALAPRLLASGPFDWPTRHVAVDGAALVGDAAGYFDPFTGQGIYHALAGAELLASSAARALRGTADGPVPAATLAGYARAHRRMVREARWLQRLIDRVMAKPRLAEAAVQRLRQAPQAAATLVAVTGDLLPAHTLLRPAILTSFLIPSQRTGGVR